MELGSNWHRRVLCRGIGWAVALCAFCLLAGCGGEGKVKLSGTVTVDGALVDKGIIRLEPADNAGTADELNVVKGQYEGSVRTGKKKLTFQLLKVIGQEHVSGDPNNPMIDKTQPYDLDSSAPTTLEITGSTKRDFALTAKK